MNYLIRARSSTAREYNRIKCEIALADPSARIRAVCVSSPFIVYTLGRAKRRLIIQVRIDPSRCAPFFLCALFPCTSD